MHFDGLFFRRVGMNFKAFYFVDTRSQIMVIDNDPLSSFILQKSFSFAGLFPSWIYCCSVMDATQYFSLAMTPSFIFIEPIQAGINADNALRLLQQFNMFERSNVCVLTIAMNEEFDAIGDAFPVFQKWAKPFRREYLRAFMQYEVAGSSAALVQP